MPDLCPRCNKNDMIQKISAIRKEGISTGVYAGPSGGVSYAGGKFGTVAGVTALRGTSITQLAALFQPPEKPKMGSPELNSKSAVGATIMVSAIIALIGLFCSFSSRGGDFLEWFIFVVVVVFAAVGFILVMQGRNEAMPAVKSSYDAEIKKWENRMDIYNRIYYCRRDDICFDPQSGHIASPSEFWLLYGL